MSQGSSESDENQMDKLGARKGGDKCNKWCSKHTNACKICLQGLLQMCHNLLLAL